MPQTPPTWPEIKKSVDNYQAYLRTLPIPSTKKVKAFLIDEATITKLLKRGTGMKAIRFYIGSDADGRGLRAFPVACEQRTDPATGKLFYHDINIPKTPPLTDSSLSLSTSDMTMDVSAADLSIDSNDTRDLDLPEAEEARPCPTECSDSNFLNPSSTP